MPIAWPSWCLVCQRPPNNVTIRKRTSIPSETSETDTYMWRAPTCDTQVALFVAICGMQVALYHLRIQLSWNHCSTKARFPRARSSRGCQVYLGFLWGCDAPEDLQGKDGEKVFKGSKGRRWQMLKPGEGDMFPCLFKNETLCVSMVGQGRPKEAHQF